MVPWEGGCASLPFGCCRSCRHATTRALVWVSPIERSPNGFSRRAAGAPLPPTARFSAPPLPRRSDAPRRRGPGQPRSRPPRRRPDRAGRRGPATPAGSPRRAPPSGVRARPGGSRAWPRADRVSVPSWLPGGCLRVAVRPAAPRNRTATLRPIPSTAHASCTRPSTRIPATFAGCGCPTTMSLGHLIRASSPTTSATATAAARGSNRGGSRSSTDSSSELPAGADQVRPCRPRPALCSAAVTIVPCGAPAAASSRARELVESVRRRCTRGVPITRPPRIPCAPPPPLTVPPAGPRRPARRPAARWPSRG